MKPMQISSAPPKILFDPIHPSCAFPFLAWQGPMHSSPWGESVQGNEPTGNYLLVWDVFCWLSSPNQLPAEGGQVPAGRGRGRPGRTGAEGGIPGDARAGGLKMQGTSHIWRDLFLPCLPYPTWGCNETFHVLALSILFLCRTGSRGAFLGVIPQLFSPYKAKISRVALIQRQALPLIPSFWVVN